MILETARDAAAAVGAALRLRGGNAVATYTQAAPRYERYRALWLRLAGGEAEAAMISELETELLPGTRVLDAGCGTGSMARRILSIERRVELTMLDLTPAMLEHARSVTARKTIGSLLELPFDDGSFDVVTCAWAVETVPDPQQAIAETVRVLGPSGVLFMTYCSRPAAWLARTVSAPLRAVIQLGFAGSFLNGEEVRGAHPELAKLRRYRGGLATFLTVRKGPRS